MNNRDGIPYSLCAFFLGDLDDKLNSTHVMVLMERIIEKHLTDVEIIGNNFSLSKKEREVLKFICQGLSNKEIAEKMFICEYTVKDHIKKIMRKMCADSRGEIVFLSRE